MADRPADLASWRDRTAASRTGAPPAPEPGRAPAAGRAPARRLVLASRGDPLTDHLTAALETRYLLADGIDPELTSWQRYAVAASTVRPTRTRWVERYYKSALAYELRTANAARLRPPGATDPVLQVHALFEVPAAPTLLYVDCTHRQAAEQWPAWNPLRGTSLQRWYSRELRAYRLAVHVFAFSRQTRDSLVGDYGVRPDRVSVVGCGINVREPDRRAAPARPAQDEPMILFVGNDFERKGGPALLAAFQVVRRQLPAARLVLVGTRPDLAASPGVTVLGRLDHDEVLALYRRASAFCLPSVFDPLPHALLEAMSYGLPCVTTPTVGVPDVVTHGRDALLVPPDSPAELAAALLDVLTDPRRAARLGAAGRERVLGQYTWGHVVDRMVPALDAALAL